mgnify:CR=1 FL=1
MYVLSQDFNIDSFDLTIVAAETLVHRVPADTKVIAHALDCSELETIYFVLEGSVDAAVFSTAFPKLGVVHVIIAFPLSSKFVENRSVEGGPVEGGSVEKGSVEGGVY